MPIRPALEFRDSLQAGNEPTAAELEAFVTANPEEEQLLEYKSGKIDEDGLKTKIRRGVTALANADGGVFIVGVGEPPSKGQPRPVEGVAAAVKPSLKEWTGRVLQGIGGAFSPFPTISVIPHPAGPVLIVATGRAPQLVSIVEEGEPRWYLRIGESTIRTPPYLISDLLLGRRNHPILEVRDVEIVTDLIEPNAPISLKVRVLIDNLGFAAAEAVEVGTLSWSHVTGRVISIGRDGGPNPHLMSFVERQSPSSYIPPGAEADRGKWRVGRRSLRREGNAPTISPFDSVQTEQETIGRFPIPGTVKFALYVMPRGSMPTWYQVYAKYTTERISGADRVTGTAKIDRIVTGKPVIHWDYP